MEAALAGAAVAPSCSSWVGYATRAGALIGFSAPTRPDGAKLELNAHLCTFGAHLCTFGARRRGTRAKLRAHLAARLLLNTHYYIYAFVVGVRHRYGFSVAS